MSYPIFVFVFFVFEQELINVRLSEAKENTNSYCKFELFYLHASKGESPAVTELDTRFHSDVIASEVSTWQKSLICIHETSDVC